VSLAIHVDHQTYEVLDDAVEQIASQRQLSLASDTGMLSTLGSLARQLDQMIDQAIAETDLGHQVTIAEIADLLGISDDEARRRYVPDGQPF
jgi:hypothetical protein